MSGPAPDARRGSRSDPHAAGSADLLAGAEGTAIGPPAPSEPEPGPRAGSFAVAAAVLAVALYLTYGLLTMAVPENVDPPGPRVFPTIITGLAYLVAVLLAVAAVRDRARPQASAEPTGRTDWRSLAGVLGAFVVFIAILTPLGWLLAGTWLFWGVAQSLGSRRRLFDLGVALAVSSVVQLAFSAGLGLNLPAGVLGVV